MFVVEVVVEVVVVVVVGSLETDILQLHVKINNYLDFVLA